MQYLDKLKKERSIDRVIFLAGMVLAFIGFMIPTVYVKDEVVSADSAVEATTEEDYVTEEIDYLADNLESDDLEFEDEEVETKVSLKNIFGAATYFNRSPVAYNATFLVVVWLCTIAGIVLFFVTKSFIGDILVVILALAFGLASVIGIAPALSDEFGAYAGYYTEAVTPFFGYASVGSYLVVVGLIVATVATVLSAMHIQHPDQVKAK
ncbi:MAG: hypothetical protein K5873_06695 [Treponema sp.]|nr:hypothetical protein [Treponema sp.]